MNMINDIDVIWYRPCFDGFVIVNYKTGFHCGFFCTERAVKEYARVGGMIARKLPKKYVPVEPAYIEDIKK